MADAELLDKIISLTEKVVNLVIENKRLKAELENERKLNKFRAKFPSCFKIDDELIGELENRGFIIKEK